MTVRLDQRARLFCCFLFFAVAVWFAPLSRAADPAATEETLPVYQTVPSNKSLLTSPQFLVIDDFNSGKLVNRRGAKWQTKAPAAGALDLTLDKNDARSPRGFSLRTDFHLLPGEKASFLSLLNKLDASEADQFVFMYKLNLENGEKFRGKIEIELSDWRHESVRLEIGKQLAANHDEWQEVIVPMRRFWDLDLDQLFSLTVYIEAGEEKLRGQFWIDEIAFFGANEVAFESLRDNLAGFPKVAFNETRRQQLLGIKNDKTFLKEIAADTWQYFENARDRVTHLVVDHIKTGDAPLAADYTSPTNIAMDLLATVAAYDLRILPKKEAIDKLGQILDTLGRMRRFKGFFYNFYETKRLSVTRSYISSVDSGWLAIALVVVRQAFSKELGAEATAFLDSFHFEEFLDPENNQMVIGFEVPVGDFGEYHYGMLVSEARATSFYAIGKGDLPREHWWFLFRTPPAAWDWQNQAPQGHYVTRGGMDYFQGYYEADGKKFVPSWGGSLFEFLMPTLVLKEAKLAPEGLGLNDRIATELQRDYALKEKGYPVWGISPAAVASGRRWSYREFGVKKMSVKGYRDEGVITPHVSFLALDTLPKDAIANIRKLLDYQIYGEYGFYDSVNVRRDRVNPQYLALDQGMVLVAIANYLKNGSIQNRFHKDPVGKNAEDLLKNETFFN